MNLVTIVIPEFFIWLLLIMFGLSVINLVLDGVLWFLKRKLNQRGNTEQTCPDCDGVGEIHKPSSVPDDEGWETCNLCGGGKVIGLNRLRAVLERQDATDAEYWNVRGQLDELQQKLEHLQRGGGRK